MAKKSKQLRAALEKIDSTKVYSVEEAVALAKETNFAKFDATGSCLQLKHRREKS